MRISDWSSDVCSSDLIALIVQAALVYALRPLMNVDGPAFTSVFQGAVRFNTFVGLGAVTALEGGTGVTLFAVAIALAIPTLNVMCVLTLARYGDHGQGTTLKADRKSTRLNSSH